MKRALLLLIIVAACGGEHRPARDRYNEGVIALDKKDFEGAEKAFLDALGKAGVDPELRHRAAYDLGAAYAGHAAQVAAAQPPEPDKALELYQQAATWFRDALRQQQGDDDARTNLAIVLARAQALADEVNKGKNGLEPRLDKVIEEQREIRDGARGLWAQIKAAAGGADPLAQQGAYEALATRERSLLAEAGVIGDLAGAEISAIGGKEEEHRSDEEKVRLVQLQNLDLYLQEARTAMSDARRQLQTQQGDAAHRRSEGALEQLKRAREQLLDPVAVLQSIAQDEVTLTQHTDALLAIGKRATLPAEVQAQVPEAAPAWLEGSTLAERQAALRDRTAEVAARLKAGLDSAAAGADAGAEPQKDPQQEKVLAQVRAALPAVEDAGAAMGRARDALAASNLEPAIKAEGDAMLALGRAIEQFAALRQVIDLSLSQQQQLVQLLGPEAAKAGSADERARAVETGVTSNLDRLQRLAALIADEKATAEAQAQQAAQGQPGQGAQPPPEGAEQQLEALRAQYGKAEELRGQALAQVESLRAALAARGKDPVAPAKAAQAKIEELRKLFFSVIEHLQQLHRDQGETRDQTASAQAEDDAGRAPRLPGLVGRQTGHHDLGQAIADALAEQADAAAQQPQQQPGAPSSQALADAATEVRQAVDAMQEGGTGLTQARNQAQQASYDLQPVLDAQAKAIEHLENALRLLSPPPPEQDQKQDQQKQDQQDQQQGQDEKKDQQQAGADKQDEQQKQQQQGGQDAQEAARRMQQVRDAEAQRRRDQQERQRAQPDPVDKDW